MSAESGDRGGPGVPWLPVVAIGVAALAAVGVIWLVAVPPGPEACALSMPGPRNCFPSQRVAAAVLPTVVTAVLTVVALTLIVIRPGERRTVAAISVIVLVGITAVSYGHVAWIPSLAWLGR